MAMALSTYADGYRMAAPEVGHVLALYQKALIQPLYREFKVS